MSTEGFCEFCGTGKTCQVCGRGTREGPPTLAAILNETLAWLDERARNLDAIRRQLLAGRATIAAGRAAEGLDTERVRVEGRIKLIRAQVDTARRFYPDQG